MTHAVEGDFGSVMEKAFLMKALGGASLLNQPDRSLLQNPRANAAEHVVLGLLLENDGVDSLFGQQLPEKEARRTGTDDDNLSAHGI